MYPLDMKYWSLNLILTVLFCVFIHPLPHTFTYCNSMSLYSSVDLFSRDFLLFWVSILFQGYLDNFKDIWRRMYNSCSSCIFVVVKYSILILYSFLTLRVIMTLRCGMNLIQGQLCKVKVVVIQFLQCIDFKIWCIEWCKNKQHLCFKHAPVWMCLKGILVPCL